MTNSAIGDEFEVRFAELLANAGFWVHRLRRGHAGEQPADIIAVRNRKSYLIDCKVVSTKKGFALSRVEENQISAMDHWKAKGNGSGWFALDTADGIYMISIEDIRAFMEEEAKSSMSLTDIRQTGNEVELWIEWQEAKDMECEWK